MTVTIRPIRREDAESVTGMTQGVRRLSGLARRSLGREVHGSALSRRRLRREPAFGGFIAEEAEQPLGYLLHTPTYDSDLACRVLFVIDLWVRPWTRRLGVGRKLMDAAAELGKQRKCGYLLWSVYKPNTLARQFYDKLGGQETADLDWMTLKL